MGVSSVRIDLSTLPGDFFAALVPAPTGVTYTALAGGLSLTTRPELEGYLVPLPSDWHKNPQPLRNHAFAGSAYDTLRVGVWLRLNRLDELFDPLPLMTERALEEGWVWVRVRKDADWRSLESARGCEVVLTYPNPD